MIASRCFIIEQRACAVTTTDIMYNTCLSDMKFVLSFHHAGPNWSWYSYIHIRMHTTLCMYVHTIRLYVGFQIACRVCIHSERPTFPIRQLYQKKVQNFNSNFFLVVLVGSTLTIGKVIRCILISS